MKLVFQPDNSYQCGQACVAMLADKTLKESIAVFGHKNRTTLKEVAIAIRHYGMNCPDEYTHIKTKEEYELPPIALCRMVKPRKRTGHYVVHYHGKFYDPYHKLFKDEKELLKHYDGWRIASYVPIEGA